MKRLSSLVLASMLAVPAVVSAGTKVAPQVSVNDWDAMGSMGTARRTLDTLQYIGCMIQGHPDATQGQCWARDAAGRFASCWFFDNQHHIDAIRSMSSDSFVYFSWWETGECSTIMIQNASQFEPKK